MSIENSREFAEQDKSTEFNPGKELVRLIKPLYPLAAIEIEHQLESDPSYDALAYKYQLRWEQIDDYRQRLQARHDIELRNQLEEEDRAEDEEMSATKQIQDWNEFNDEQIKAIESWFAKYNGGDDSKNNYSNYIQQIETIMQVIHEVDAANRADVVDFAHLPKIPWDEQDDAVLKEMQNLSQKNPAAELFASEWQRMRKTGYHPYEIRKHLFEQYLPQKLMTEYPLKEDRERYMIEVNHQQYRAQAHRSLVSDCRFFSERGNKFAPTVLAKLEEMTPEERADYHKVREQCLSAIGAARDRLGNSTPDEKNIQSERVLREQIDLYTID